MSKYKKVIGVTLSNVDNEFVIVKGREVYKINEVGARIFDLCNGTNVDKDIVQKLSSFYGIEYDILETDIKDHIGDLINLNLIKKVN